MSEVAARLREHLEGAGVAFEVIHHRTDFQASVTAHDTDTPLAEFAKTVFVFVDDRPAMAVVPADRDVALGRLRDFAGAAEVSLAEEDDIAALCPDCEIGAAPPFGNLYALPVYVSRSLAEDDEITFNAGTHNDAIRMSYSDFERLVEPRVLALCKGE